MQHELIARPWSKVGADLCEFSVRTLLVGVDYYSNFIEVTRMTTTTSRSIIKAMKEVFARFGIPDVVVTDNGPQFSSAEFSVFARMWNFDHVTSSPHHPQSNGKAENAVKTVKRLFKKCKDSGQSEFLALLDWRNTPTEGVGTSPTQRPMVRRCRTLLPIAGTLLQPRQGIEQETRALTGMKQRQQFYYNKHAKPLKPIVPGETVRMKLPGQEKWSAGICKKKVDDRSCVIRMGNVEYRRNRKHLIATQEEPLPDVEDAGDITPPVTGKTISSTGEESTSTVEPNTTGNTSAESRPPPPRRSERVRKAPAWHQDYSLP